MKWGRYSTHIYVALVTGVFSLEADELRQQRGSHSKHESRTNGTGWCVHFVEIAYASKVGPLFSTSTTTTSIAAIGIEMPICALCDRDR
jgi:hypothetical protein